MWQLNLFNLQSSELSKAQQLSEDLHLRILALTALLKRTATAKQADVVKCYTKVQQEQMVSKTGDEKHPWTLAPNGCHCPQAAKTAKKKDPKCTT